MAKSSAIPECFIIKPIIALISATSFFNGGSEFGVCRSELCLLIISFKSFISSFIGDSRDEIYEKYGSGFLTFESSPLTSVPSTLLRAGFRRSEERRVGEGG